MSAKRLLWITPKWPLPANDGARQATTQLVTGLCRRGAEIDLVALVPEGEGVHESMAVEALGVRSAAVVRRPPPGPLRHAVNFCRRPLEPLTLAQYTTPKLREELRKRARDEKTAIVFDGLHAAAWLRDPGTWTGAPFIYRAHNVESDLWFRAAKSRREPVSSFLRMQGRAVRRFERELCAAARQVLAVSDEDRDRFLALVPEANVSTLPIGMEPKPRRTNPAESTRLLFVGRLDWPPNRDGLAWFLEEVWPGARDRFTLDIVGSGDGAWLSAHLDDPRLHFHGVVDSLTPYYHGAILTIVPIFYGSGTRVKAIESSLYATACLGTARGVEGIGLDPGRDYFRAESKEDWLAVLDGLDPEEARRRGQRALETVSERFDRDRTAAQFLSATTGS